MAFNLIKTSESIRSFYRWVVRLFLMLGLAFFFILFYKFLPSYFGFLLSSSPIIICTGVLVYAFLKFRRPNFHKDEKKDDISTKTHLGNNVHKDEKKDDISTKTHLGNNVHKDEKKDDTSTKTHLGINVHKDEKKDDFSTKTHLGIRGDDIIDEFVKCSLECLNDSCAVSDCSIASNDGSCEMEDEAERLEDEVQPAEWTEDEKKLMDLGTSEVERSRRLENLIIKRRARTFSRLVAEKDLDNRFLQIPPITTRRNEPSLEISYNPSDAGELPPIPCSAPVLLTSRNPFDIPYDPLEEKPNLIEGSFQEEFFAVLQKDAHLCRHESFCLGPSFMEDPKKDVYNSKLTPFIGVEQVTSNKVMGGGYPFPPEATCVEKGDYAATSTATGLDDQEKFIEQDLSQEGTVIFHNGFVLEKIEQESQASNEVVISSSEDTEQEESIKEELICGSEVPCDASCHPSDEGNESRSKLTNNRGTETTGARHLVDNDDQTAETSDDQVSSDSSLVQVPSATSNLKLFLDEKEKVDIVACSDSDALSHETLALPFNKGMSYSNEVPYDACSHHGGDEIESSGTNILWSNEVNTETGLSRNNDDLVTPHPMSESMVVEQISCHSFPELTVVENTPANMFPSPHPSNDQVLLHISDPEILIEEEKENSAPLIEELIVQLPTKRVHEEPQPHFLLENPSLNGEEPQQIPVNEEKENSVILIEKPIVQPPHPRGAYEEPQTQFFMDETSSNGEGPQDIAVDEEPTNQPLQKGIHEEPQMQFLMEEPSVDGEKPQVIFVDEEKERLLPFTKAPIVQSPSKEVLEEPHMQSLEEPSLNGEEPQEILVDEEKEKLVPSMEKPIDELPCRGVDEEPQRQFLMKEPSLNYEEPWEIAVDENEKLIASMKQPPCKGVHEECQIQFLMEESSFTDEEPQEIHIDEENKALMPLMEVPPYKGVHEEPQTQVLMEEPPANNEERQKILMNEEKEEPEPSMEEHPHKGVYKEAQMQSLMEESSLNDKEPQEIPTDKEDEKLLPLMEKPCHKVVHQEPQMQFLIGEPSQNVEKPKAIPVDEEREKLALLMMEPTKEPLTRGVHEELQTPFLIEESSIIGEESQDQSTILVNPTEKANITASMNKQVVCQDGVEDNENSKPTEVNEAESTLHSGQPVLEGESLS